MSSGNKGGKRQKTAQLKDNEPASVMAFEGDENVQSPLKSVALLSSGYLKEWRELPSFLRFYVDEEFAKHGNTDFFVGLQRIAHNGYGMLSDEEKA